MALREYLKKAAIRFFRSQRQQQFLDRVACHIDNWRGYGAGVYVESSGESVLFDVVRRFNLAGEHLVVFDVGANIGDFTAATLEEIGGNVDIHAFEPAKNVFATLSHRFGTNSLVTLNNVAI